MHVPIAGYREIEHTADWELHVWAPDLAALLEQAARGMFALSGAKLKTGDRIERKIELQAEDAETLLVTFLSELLFAAESEGLGFDIYKLHLDGYHLQAELQGAELCGQNKEIKAVTYHRLAVKETGNGLEVNIVFDV
jgi:SHS2 domain-containing protein